MHVFYGKFKENDADILFFNFLQKRHKENLANLSRFTSFAIKWNLRRIAKWHKKEKKNKNPRQTFCISGAD